MENGPSAGLCGRLLLPLSVGCADPSRPQTSAPRLPRPHTLAPVQLAWRNQESPMPEIAGKLRQVPT